MAKSEKSNLPAYISYSYFTSFINGLRETHIPLQIDRTVMPKASGSMVSSMLVSLRFLQLIDENNKPTALMKQLVEAADDNRGPIIKKVMTGAYSFVINGDFDLEKATGAMVAEKFREAGAAGFTGAKAIGFFLAAAKDAGIKVSPHIKPPQIQRVEGKRTGRRRQEETGFADDNDDEVVDPSMVRFELPIPGKRNAIVTVPDDLSSDDWEMLTKMLSLYIERMQKSGAA